MGLTSGIVVFFLVWWTALFIVLPIGIRPDAEGAAPGNWRGAPTQVRILRIVLLNTALSALIWLSLHAVISSDFLSFRSGWLAMPNE